MMDAAGHPLDAFFDALTKVTSGASEHERLATAVCFGIHLAESDPTLAKYLSENTIVGPDDARIAVQHVFDQLTATFREIVRLERPGDLEE